MRKMVMVVLAMFLSGCSGSLICEWETRDEMYDKIYDQVQKRSVENGAQKEVE